MMGVLAEFELNLDSNSAYSLLYFSQTLSLRLKYEDKIDMNAFYPKTKSKEK